MAENITPAETSGPSINNPQPVTLTLSAEDVRDLGTILDAAIRQSGYSPVSAAAIRIGLQVANVVQRQ